MVYRVVRRSIVQALLAEIVAWLGMEEISGLICSRV